MTRIDTLCLYHVEDNEADRRLLALAFEALDAAVELQTASDGEQALEILAQASKGQRREPDLVILDLNLPRYSGIEVLAWMRKNDELRRGRVVILTSSDSTTDKTEAEALGIDAYVLKPLYFNEYLSLAAKLLEVARRA